MLEISRQLHNYRLTIILYKICNTHAGTHKHTRTQTRTHTNTYTYALTHSLHIFVFLIIGPYFVSLVLIFMIQNIKSLQIF